MSMTSSMGSKMRVLEMVDANGKVTEVTVVTPKGRKELCTLVKAVMGEDER